MTKILAFAASTKKTSLNKKLLQVAIAAAEEAGGNVTEIDLLDFPMPIFSEDLESEEGMPEHAGRFKELLLEHDGFLISTPEYNSFFPPVLKNAIDWASRSQSKDEPSLSAFRGKAAGIMSAALGGTGGIRSMSALRLQLEYIGVIVIPNQVGVPQAHTAFNEDGTMTDPRKQKAVEIVASDLVHTVDRLNA